MLGCLKIKLYSWRVNKRLSNALEPPVCSDFVHDCFNTLSASWAPNLLQSKLFLMHESNVSDRNSTRTKRLRAHPTRFILCKVDERKTAFS